MDNFSFIVVTGIIGLIIAMVSFLIQYRRANSTVKEGEKEISIAEQEIIAQIKKGEISKLTLTNSGRELLVLLGEKLGSEAAYVAKEIAIRGDYAPSLREADIKQKYTSSQILILAFITALSTGINYLSYPISYLGDLFSIKRRSRSVEPIKKNFSTKTETLERKIYSPSNQKPEKIPDTNQSGNQSSYINNSSYFGYAKNDSFQCKFGENLYDPIFLKVFLEDTGRISKKPICPHLKQKVLDSKQGLYQLWELLYSIFKTQKPSMARMENKLIQAPEFMEEYIRLSIDNLCNIWNFLSENFLIDDNLIIYDETLELFASYLRSLNYLRNLKPFLKKARLAKYEDEIENLIFKLSASGFILYGENGLQVIKILDGK